MKSHNSENKKDEERNGNEISEEEVRTKWTSTEPAPKITGRSFDEHATPLGYF